MSEQRVKIYSTFISNFKFLLDHFCMFFSFKKSDISDHISYFQEPRHEGVVEESMSKSEVTVYEESRE